MPLRAVPIGSQTGGVSQRVHVRNDPGDRFLESPPQVVVRNDGEGHTDSGQVERLAGGHESERVCGDFGTQRGDGQVLDARLEDQFAVNLVGADDEIVAQAEFSERLQFLAGECPADGIVGVAKHEQSRFRRDRRFECFEIESPALSIQLQRRGAQFAPHVFRCAQKRWIDRHGAEYLVAHIAGGAAGGVQSGNQSRQPDDPFFFDFPGVFLFQAGLDGRC